MDYQYPVTIVADRYAGTYSGGNYTAWPLYPHQLPDGHDDGDSECMNFWYEYKEPVGKGRTPQAAFEDLLVKVGKVAR